MLKKCLPLLLILLAGCSPGIYTQGQRWVEQGEYDRAIDSYYKDIAANPKSAEAWRELGIAFYKKGDLDKAEDAFKQVNNIKPDPTAYLYVGLIYEKREQYDRAIDAYTAALNLKPSGDTKTMVRSHLDNLASQRINREIAAAIASESTIDASSIPSNTIAVVNFDGSHLAPELAPLGNGLAEFTAMDLSKVKSLKVVERTKIDAIIKELKLGSSQYADPVYAPRMGRLLGSRNVVTGTLLGIGDKGIRLDGAVANTVDSSAKVTKTSEGELDKFFRLEKEFVLRIIDNLGITLTAEERDSIQRVPTESYLAFMAYCRGLNYRSRGMYGEARREFHVAAQEDRSFQEAYTQFKAVPKTPPSGGGQSDFQSFESSVEGQPAKEETEAALGGRLSAVVHNTGAVPDLSDLNSLISQPVIGNTGIIIIKGDFDVK